jgi:hypothetical protein
MIARRNPEPGLSDLIALLKCKDLGIGGSSNILNELGPGWNGVTALSGSTEWNV